jgi:hypothetical protein
MPRRTRAGQPPFCDAPQARSPLGDLTPAYLSADRGHATSPLVAASAARGTCAVILPRRQRRQPRAYDLVRYAQPQAVERLFSRLAPWPRATTSWLPILWPLFN